MREEIMTFGSYIRQIRIDRNLSMLEVASALGYGNPQWCEFEKNRRNPPPFEVLEKLAQLLHMTPEEYGTMMDLAGEGRDMAPPDLTDYILATPGVTAALRQARDLDLQEDDWQIMLEALKKRKGLR